MIDYFAIAVSHGLLLLAAWRLLQRPDLDHEATGAEDKRSAVRGMRAPGSALAPNDGEGAERA